MKLNYKALLSIILTFFLVSYLSAGPIDNKVFKVSQPNGLELELRGFGDEWYHVVETIDGYTVRINKEGWWTYAVKNNNGDLVASNIIVGSVNNRSIVETNFITSIGKHLRANEENIKEMISLNPHRMDSFNSESMIKSLRDTVTWKVLVLLIDYTDMPGTENLQSFDDMMNLDGYEGGYGATGSFNEYYRESSYGKFGINADINGWYHGANGFLHYGNQNGMSVAQELVAEAVDQAEADGVDFSIYDNDGNGEVDQVLVVHAGLGAEQNGDERFIWAHKWNLSATGRVRNYDGVRIDFYTIQPEKQYGRHAGIGMYAHEFGHAIGLPDLYDYGFDSEGIGNWGVMAGGAWLNSGRTPPHFCPWAKEELGWITPTNITESGAMEFTPIEFDESAIYKIDIPTDDSEFFMVENRKRIGFDSYLPGEGLLIWHMDTQMSGNDNELRKLVDVEEADGRDDLDNTTNRGDAGDIYPGSSQNRVFDSYSYPNSKDYADRYSLVSISNISDPGDTITADVQINALVYFTSQNKTGHAPCETSFIDSSIAGSAITTWEWDFDNDGTIDSYDQNPSFTYSLPGLYSVKLKISDGTLNASVVYENYITVFDGESALSFDRNSSSAIIEATPELNISDKFTFDAWIYPTDWGTTPVSGFAKVFDKSILSAYLQKSTQGNYREHSLTLSIRDENNKTIKWNTPTNSIRLNQWQHVSISLDYNSLSVEIRIDAIDQELVQVGTWTGLIKDNSSNNFILGNNSLKSRPFQGYIDEVRLWNSFRTIWDVRESYGTYLSGSESGLLGYWNFNEGNGEIINDQSSISNNGISSASWTYGVNFASVTSVEDDELVAIPEKYELFNNYPNPFNPTTNIKFAIPSQANVKLRIFNVLGELQKEIVNKDMNAGYHTFSFDASYLSTGVYFYNIVAQGSNGKQFIETKKMILLK